MSRERGWRKREITRISRIDRFRRRHRCYLKVGAFTVDGYCGVHGRAEGWPCRFSPRTQLTAWPGVRADQIKVPRIRGVRADGHR